MKEIVLASASPRRKKLLEQLGIEFKVCPSKFDESQVEKSNPEELVQTLSYLKAKEVAAREEGVVIAADTVVNLKQEILEKPITKQEAYQMLNKLSGTKHQVTTGITVICNSQVVTEYQQTTVKFRQITDQEIDRYIASGEPMDKAGAYGIQAKGAIFVEKIEGCFYNVVGLPLARLGRILMSLGVEIKLNE